jgi:cysteine desulfurase/selenocysteine lyase
LNPDEYLHFKTKRKINSENVKKAMNMISYYIRSLTQRAMDKLKGIKGITIYGPRDTNRRTGLIAFNVTGHNPFKIAEALNDAGVESRAGCHCATLAHRHLHLNPPASCRLSFYFYNTPDEVEYAVNTVAKIIDEKRSKVF